MGRTSIYHFGLLTPDIRTALPDDSVVHLGAPPCSSVTPLSSWARPYTL